MKEDKLWIWLHSCARISRSKQYKLVGYFGDIESVYKANLSDYSALNYLSPEDLDALSKKDLAEAEDIQRELTRYSARVITRDSSLYPDLLATIHQPPTVLYVRGSYTDFNSSLMLAMVGTRKATNYGKASAFNLAKELSDNGIVVVSGMAMGIDAKSHEGALAGHSPTIAVTGCGVDTVYPPSNAALMEKIMKNGAVVSEYPLFTPPEKYHFPERNRIIAGMTKGTIVVEADLKSGSLITAKHAMEENRDVFAIPGNINTYTSKGTNYLLKDGANMLTTAGDIISFYGLEYRPKPAPADDFVPLSTEDKILHAIGEASVHTDTICQKTHLDAGTVNSTLLMLEIQGRVMKLAGGYYSLIKNI